MTHEEKTPTNALNTEVFPAGANTDPLNEELARRRIAERVARNVPAPPPIDALPAAPVPAWRRLPVILSAVAVAGLLCLAAAVLALHSVAGSGAPLALAAENTRATRALVAGDAAPTDTPLGQPPAAPGSNAPTAETPATDNVVVEGAFLLFYDTNTFYIYNQSGQDYPVNNLAFELLNRQGDSLVRVDGRYWSRFYGRFKNDACLVINRFGVKDPFQPKPCRNNVLVYRSPTDEQNMFFWVAQPDASEFRVLWQGQEAARCPVDAGTCGVNLP